MKLLFDANLSFRLVEQLNDLYPDSIHVRKIALEKSSDQDIWDYAQNNGFTVVTKDADFHEYTIVRGSPPKVIWIRRGNCSTIAIEELLRTHHVDIQLYHSDPDASCLILI